MPGLETTFRRTIGLRIVDLIKRTNMVNLNKELQNTQWLPKGELEAIQIHKLRNLLAHAYKNVPYYENLFDKVGFNPDTFEHFQDLQQLPVLTKKQIRAHFESMMARNIREFSPRPAATSGSTGEPLVYCRDRLSHSTAWASNWRAYTVAGFKLGDPVVVLTGGSLMPRLKQIKMETYFSLMGIRKCPSHYLSEKEMQKYIAVLSNKSLPYLFCYATAAEMLARHVIKNNIEGVAIEAIFTTSEVLFPTQRKLVQDTFHCPVYDTYGNNETSLYAFECSFQEGLHYGMENAYLEVLDDEHQPVPAGQPGHIVATNLANYAMPFIRYDTTDLGSLSTGDCRCGRGLKRIDSIIGRSTDFVVTPKGRKVKGRFFHKYFFKPWIAGSFIVQDKIDHITIRLRPDGDPVSSDMERIKDLVIKDLDGELKVDIVLDEKIFMTRTGKQKVVESLIPKD